MYEYSRDANPLNLLSCPSDIEFQLDNITLGYPYVPRICEEQGHMLIWWGTQETDPDLAEESFKVKGEAQWINCEDPTRIEKGVALIYPYDNEVIIGSLKVPGYFHLTRSAIQQRAFLRKMWKDIVNMFGDRRIVCPSGTYFNYLHLSINQIRIPREAYHRELMKQFGFSRQGDFWIRETL